MGGFGSGGARVGTGPKPRSLRDRALTNARIRPPFSTFSNEEEPPQPPRSVSVRPPPGLTADERRFWDSLAPSLKLTPADRDTFADYCRASCWIEETHRRKRAAWTRKSDMRLIKMLDVQLCRWLRVKARLVNALGLTGIERG